MSSPRLSRQAVRLARGSRSTEEELMSILREIDVIYAEWEERVRREGNREGFQTMLLVQLRQRFGEPPDDVRTRIEQADMDDLQRWAERVIPASSLADVFA